MPADPGPMLVLYNMPAGGGHGGLPSACRESEAGILAEVEAVSAALARLGVPHERVGLRDLADLPGALYRHAAGLAVNLVEGFQHAPNDMTLVPAVCRAFGVEVTGSDTPCLSLALDKWKTNSLLTAHGIRCPRGVLVPVGQPLPSAGLPAGTCIVKPAASDASEGIDAHSLADAASPTLHDLVRQIHDTFNQAALVEELVGERELNVSLLQVGERVQILAIAEIDLSSLGPDRPKIVGYAAKWLPDSYEYAHTPRILPARLAPGQQAQVRRVSLAAWQALGCRDYARVDFRLDDRGEPVVLEVNPNPDISPEDGFAAALTAAGITYDRFVRTLLDNARRRCPATTSPAHTVSGISSPALTETSRIRYVTREDRDAVLALLTQPKFFRPDELKIGQEVLDDSIRDGAGGHYQSFVLEEDGQVSGWVCFGPTPCAVGTYDIYWIAVAASRQRGGIGAALMDFVETRIRERGGRLAIIETSGRDGYAPTRAFYLKLGYREASRVRDFYAPGDDKIISVKTL